MLAIATLDTFSQTGFHAALIHKKNPTKIYLDTAWTISIIRGAILFIILFISAPFFADFFNTSQATLVIRVIAFSTLMSGLRNIGIVYFQKDLEFHKQFWFAFSIAIVDMALSITLAFILRNVWALVFGGLSANLIGLVLSYILHPYRPKIKIDYKIFKELFSFGKWLFGSSIIIFLASHGDDAFLGKILGVTALGYYQMAFNIGNFPSSETAGVISKVAFPAFVKLKEVSHQLKGSYLKTVRIVILLSAPLTSGIIVLAPQFTQLFLGEKWLPIVLPLQILALSGMFRSIAGTGGSIFNAIGKPKLDFVKDTIRLIVVVLTIYPFTKLWGITGTSLSVLFGLIASCLVWLRSSMREMKTTLKEYLSIFYPPIIGSISMCIVISIVLKISAICCSQISSFVLTIIISMIFYLSLMLLMEKRLNYNGLKELKIILKQIRGAKI